MWAKQLEHISGEMLHSVSDGIVSTLSNLYRGAKEIGRAIDVMNFTKWRADWHDQWLFFNESRLAVFRLFSHGHEGVLFCLIQDILRDRAKLSSSYSVGHTVSKDEARTLDSVNDHVIRGGGYVYGKYFISKRLIIRLAHAIAHQVMIRFGAIVASDTCEFEIPCLGLIVSAVSVEGVVRQSIEARNRLRAKNPSLYQTLKHQRIEMLYFLVEKPMEKFHMNIKQCDRC